MQKQTIEKLMERREILLKEISATGAKVLRGSIIERYNRCGNENCKCSKSKGHGPKHYLSVSFPKSFPMQDYVPQKYVEQIKEYVQNYKQVQTFLEEISNINREILRRRETL